MTVPKLPDHFFMEDRTTRYEYKLMRDVYPHAKNMFPADKYMVRRWTIHNLLKTKEPEWEWAS